MEKARPPVYCESSESVNAWIVGCLQAQKPDRIGVNAALPTTHDNFTGYWNGWALTMCLADAPHVLEESEERAARHNFRPPWDVVRRCKRRIELWSDEDPNMDYFNTYLLILEEMERKFAGAILVGEQGLI